MSETPLHSGAKPRTRRPRGRKPDALDENYVTVPARIAAFRGAYPDGRLRQKSLQFLEFAGKSWVVYTAQAWRTPDDPAPAEGTAWEPVPGATLYTKDSEVQNAETAAWGRAIVAALAADTTKGIASQDEIDNRDDTDEPTTDEGTES